MWGRTLLKMNGPDEGDDDMESTFGQKNTDLSAFLS
jgi:hypothetical protein